MAKLFYISLSWLWFRSNLVSWHSIIIKAFSLLPSFFIIQISKYNSLFRLIAHTHVLVITLNMFITFLLFQLLLSLLMYLILSSYTFIMLVRFKFFSKCCHFICKMIEIWDLIVYFVLACFMRNSVLNLILIQLLLITLLNGTWKTVFIFQIRRRSWHQIILNQWSRCLFMLKINLINVA